MMSLFDSLDVEAFQEDKLSTVWKAYLRNLIYITLYTQVCFQGSKGNQYGIT